MADVQNPQVPEGTPAEAPLLQGQQQSSSSQRRAQIPSAQMAAAGAGLPGTASGAIGGLQTAGQDFVAFWHAPHGQLFDSQMATLDANGIKREFVGYGALALLAGLLCTGLAPLVANLICIAYPISASLSILRGNSNESQRMLVYWIIFGLLSIGDCRLGQLAIYWLLKVAVCVFLYLPQTQGALLVYAAVIEPLVNLVNAHVLKRLA